MTHLWETYDAIDDNQLGENLTTMSTPWSPPTPIKILITRLKECQKFAQKGNDPITDAAAIRTGVQLIEANGLFDISCREWRAKTTASRTMTAFKAHFRLAENEYNRATTAASAGYNTANTAVY